MLKHLVASVSIALFLGYAALPASAQALKGAGTCNDEYKTNKAAIKAAKEKRGDFVLACRALPPGTPTPIAGTAPAAPGAPASRTSDVGTYKTAGQCNDEYKQAKAALKAAKETKKDFVSACRSLPPGTQTPIPGAAAGPAPVPAPAPTPAPAAPQQAAPRQAPSPTTTTRVPAPAAPTTPTSANQFQTETQAKARCPSATVVWLNTQSGVYHFAGFKNYGNTKAGAYMCETDATAAGDRASKTEKHP